MIDTKTLSTFLVGRGYTNQINEALYDFLQDQGYGGQLNEMLYHWLGSLGYEGTLNEREKQWLNDGMLVPHLPVNVVAPVLTGTVEVGGVLTASTGDWDAVPDVDSYTYVWQTTDGDVVSTIPGATSSSYEITDDEIGLEIRVVVTAINSVGSEEAVSEWTSEVPNPYYIPVNTSAPVMTGTAEVDETLTTTTGVWDANPAVTSYEYRWQQRTPPSGTASTIAGQSSSTFDITEDFVGQQIRSGVRATNSQGTSNWVDSSYSGTVPEVVPVITSAWISDTVDGDPVTGAEVGQLLYAVAGGVENEGTLSYEWRLNGVPISGATGATYETEGEGDLTVVITVTNSAGSDSTESGVVEVESGELPTPPEDEEEA